VASCAEGPGYQRMVVSLMSAMTGPGSANQRRSASIDGRMLNHGSDSDPHVGLSCLITDHRDRGSGSTNCLCDYCASYS
jgi:hypothetical protein